MKLKIFSRNLLYYIGNYFSSSWQTILSRHNTTPASTREELYDCIIPFLDHILFLTYYNRLLKSRTLGPLENVNSKYHTKLLFYILTINILSVYCKNIYYIVKSLYKTFFFYNFLFSPKKVH